MEKSELEIREELHLYCFLAATLNSELLFQSGRESHVGNEAERPKAEERPCSLTSKSL